MNITCKYLVLSLAALVAPLCAGVVYSNFGPGNTYDTSIGWIIGWEPGLEQGDAFTPSSTFTLGQIEFAAGLISGANQIELLVMSDSGGLPDSVIESFSFTGALGPHGQPNPPLVAISTLNPVLQAGVRYWLIARAPDPSTYAAWNLNSQSVIGLHAFRFSGELWETNSTFREGAFRISDATEVVPEPGTFLLLLPSLALIGLKRWSRH